MKALPVGADRDRVRLFDNQWRPIWDSATAVTPAYAHISTEVHAVIDHPDGTRWAGQFYRCPEGIKRATMPDFRYLRMLLEWPTFTYLEKMG